MIKPCGATFIKTRESVVRDSLDYTADSGVVYNVLIVIDYTVTDTAPYELISSGCFIFQFQLIISCESGTMLNILSL